ncbi:hypothetical protein IE53DRAFT_316870 [Violaceomyces palustris]|uniref:Uncharacterized protein n=1 Tax=Violaceomyces palustris TaxID=1673888 RepID=A0ACD0NVK7_9BASI|nr:hypothetical protein IE53DRAFT_316870 [Violaceomyces palustris]
MSQYRPLCVAPIPFESLPKRENDQEVKSFVIHYVRESFRLVRQSDSWAKGKVFTFEPKKGGKVQSKSSPSGMQGPLKRLGWHMRSSHHPKAATGLGYDEFRDGLLLNHSLQESKYIHDIKETKKIDWIKEGVAEIWLNAYKLPIVTSDRDFLEMIITVDLPDHAQPFSEDHERETVSAFEASIEPVSEEQGREGADRGGKLRSFLVIQFPVTHPEAAERAGYVRASYASFEAVSESLEDEGSVDWRMAVQSNSGGRIPVMLQEMSMAGKISVDVPFFIEWRQSK